MEQLHLFDPEEYSDNQQTLPIPTKRVIEEKDIEDDSSEQLDLMEIERVSSRTWIRYFGGKQSAVKEILACFPEGLTEVVSPFVGGGSIEMALAAKGMRVHAYDKFDTLVKCWQTMLGGGAGEAAKLAAELYPMAARCMKCSPENKLTKPEDVDVECLKCMVLEGAYHTIEDPIKQAAYCWVANKQDWNGRFLGATGFFDHREGASFDEETGLDKYSKRRRIVKRALNSKFWNKWRNPNITIEEACWTDSLPKHKGVFIYADPPYVGNEGVYGVYRNKKTHPDYEEFDHEAFGHYMTEEQDAGAVISYVNDKAGLIKAIYSNYEIIPMKWHQGSIASRGKNKADSGKEITIIIPPAVNPLKRYEK